MRHGLAAAVQLLHRMLWAGVELRGHRHHRGLRQFADQQRHHTQRLQQRFHLGTTATPLRGTSLPLISAPCAISITP